MRDVEESDERLVIEMDNRPDLTNVRGAIQGGLGLIVNALPHVDDAPQVL